MGDGPQASEEAAVPHLLEVAFAHVLPAKRERRVGHNTKNHLLRPVQRKKKSLKTTSQSAQEVSS